MGGERRATGGDRFEILGKLGAGGMGVVYRAIDHQRGSEVALKVLSNVTGRDVYRFKREFRALADVAHPNLVSLYELHTVGDDWFLTMELVVGASFIEWVRPGMLPVWKAEGTAPTGVVGTPGPELDDATSPTGSGSGGGPRGSRARVVAAALDVERLEAALYQLCDTVHALHQAGKLHRDLKPSNVLVNREGRVSVLDFGLIADMSAGEAERTHESHGGAPGTPSYMSPEQAQDQPLTQASDWYSVGVMIYEALTGRRPVDLLDGADAALAPPPPPPETFNPGAPPHLARLAMALLARDPVERPGGEAVLAALGREPSAASRELALSLQAVPFVGREKELERLRGALARARAGHGVAVMIRGVSGIGKTALHRRFLDEVAAESPEAIILRGRCYERESVPYKTLDTVVDALTTHLLGLPAAELEALLPRDVEALARLFPATRRVQEIAEPPVRALQPPDPIELRRRAFGALRELLTRLAHRAPLVITLDDLQWGDVDSGNFLAELLMHPEAPPLCMLLAHRAEDELGSPLLAALRRARTALASGELVAAMAFEEISLEPLSSRESRVLVRLVGGNRNPAHARDVVRDAGGSPLFLSEMMRASDPSQGLDDAVRTRVARLPVETCRLAQLCAVAARPLRQSVAMHAAGLHDEGQSLANLRVERILRVRRAGDAEPELETYHDRIRSAIVGGLDDDEIRGLHHSLATILEAEPVPDREALVQHWLGAGLPERAARHAELAGAAAEERLAFHQAAQLYQLALESGQHGEDDRRRTLTRMAYAFMHSGALPSAADAFGRAAAMATRSDERLELTRFEMEQRLRCGQMEAGVALARQLLSVLGFEVPRTAGRALVSMLGQRILLNLRGLEFKERDEATIPAARLQRLGLMQSLSNGFTYANPVFGRSLQTRLVRETLRIGEPHRVGIAFCLELGYLGTLGTKGYAKAMTLGQRTVALGERLAYGRVIGHGRAAMGLVAYLCGRWREACELARAGERILREAGEEVRWELDVTEMFLATAVWCLGDVRELVRLVSIYLRDAEERGDAYAQRGLRGWRTNVAWLAIGQPAEARAQLAAAELPLEPGQPAQVSHYYELLSAGLIDLYEDDGAGAHRRVEATWPALEKAMLTRIQAVNIEGTYLRARAALAAAAAAPDPGARTPLLTLAARCARTLEREATPWAGAYALAVRAGAARLAGAPERELAHLRDAAAAFDATEMGLFAAATRHRLGVLLAGDEGAELTRAAEAHFHAQGVPDRPSLTRVLFGVA
jgi:serine/threonine protein kinase